MRAHPLKVSQTHSIIKVLMPWFTILLVPIDLPKAIDIRRFFYVYPSIRSPDRDAFDLDGHIRACIRVGPILGSVAQNPPVLTFPVGDTVR